MIEFRLGDIFHTSVAEPENHYIYVVRDGETVLYVGKSVQPFYRLTAQHCHYKALIVKLRPILNIKHADIKPYHEFIREPPSPPIVLVPRKPRGRAR